jgi:hypothetical protein
MSESFSYENLHGGSQKDIVNRPATVRMGEVFSRGALIGRLTATGKWQEIAFANKATCGEFGIAVEAVDSSAAEVKTTVLVEGEFNENHVTFFYGDTADTWREYLASVGIYLRASVGV